MDDTDGAAFLAPMIHRLVRATTLAVMVAAALGMAIDLLAPLLFDRAPSLRLQLALAVVVATAVVTRRVDVVEALRTGHERWILNLFPLVIACAAASLVTSFGQGSVISLALLLAINIAGLTSKAPVAVATLAVQVVAEVTALVTADEPDLRWTLGAVLVAAAVLWTSRSATQAALRALERQQHAMEEVERVASARQDFVATVSHELRTPVHVTSGLAETLDERWEVLAEEDRRDFVGRLRRSGEGLRHLVDGLLDFSRLQSDSLEVRPVLFDFGPIATGVVAAAATAHPDHDVVLESTSTQQVVGDPLLVERVVDNLVQNACRHTPAGTTVSVRAEHAGEEIEVMVVDDGPGIPPEDLPRLSERFFRGGDHLQRDASGVGLGLAVCAEVLRLHGRELAVESRPGAGATFSFRLPVAGAPRRAARAE